jgi:hypothetical protein
MRGHPPLCCAPHIVPDALDHGVRCGHTAWTSLSVFVCWIGEVNSIWGLERLRSRLLDMVAHGGSALDGGRLRVPHCCFVPFTTRDSHGWNETCPANVTVSRFRGAYQRMHSWPDRYARGRF